jgi:preprotein translocase subunit SecB
LQHYRQTCQFFSFPRRAWEQEIPAFHNIHFFKEEVTVAEKPNPARPQETPPKEQFAIQHIYIKDVSFETPNSPQIFREQWKPQLQIEITADSTSLDEGTYEAVLNITATVSIEDQTAFLVEVHQAGIFTIAGFDEERLSYVLNISCSHVLFPYARATISSLVVQGGFHPLLLPQPNFEAMYAQRLQQAKASAKKVTLN